MHPKPPFPLLDLPVVLYCNPSGLRKSFYTKAVEDDLNEGSKPGIYPGIIKELQIINRFRLYLSPFNIKWKKMLN
jgi:hypothetical protein